MVIILTRILWSIVDTIDQKEKLLTDGLILSMVSMTYSIDRSYRYCSIDPSPIMPSYEYMYTYILYIYIHIYIHKLCIWRGIYCTYVYTCMYIYVPYLKLSGHANLLSDCFSTVSQLKGIHILRPKNNVVLSCICQYFI